MAKLFSVVLCGGLLMFFGCDAETGELGNNEDGTENGTLFDLGQRTNTPIGDIIGGTYCDENETVHDISSAQWTIETRDSSETFDLIIANVEGGEAPQGWVISGELHHPGHYININRFDVTTAEGELYFCQSLSDAESVDAAIDADEASNPSDLLTGCGDVAWTRLTWNASFPLEGTYAGGPGSTTDLVIDAKSWRDGYGSVFHWLSWDAVGQFAIAQNDAANEFNPGLYSRFDWFRGDDGVLYHCQTRYDAATKFEALDSERSNSSDPSTGCGENNFPWSPMTPL